MNTRFTNSLMLRLRAPGSCRQTQHSGHFTKLTALEQSFAGPGQLSCCDAGGKGGGGPDSTGISLWGYIVNMLTARQHATKFRMRMSRGSNVCARSQVKQSEK